MFIAIIVICLRNKAVFFTEQREQILFGVCDYCTNLRNVGTSVFQLDYPIISAEERSTGGLEDWRTGGPADGPRLRYCG